jgi:hypothetical protein
MKVTVTEKHIENAIAAYKEIKSDIAAMRRAEDSYNYNEELQEVTEGYARNCPLTHALIEKGFWDVCVGYDGVSATTKSATGESVHIHERTNEEAKAFVWDFDSWFNKAYEFFQIGVYDEKDFLFEAAKLFAGKTLTVWEDDSI